jgi:Raf kinase inhibitor-like YbhB/YbcL family protein
MALTLSTAAFANGGVIPARHTCEGADESPPLSWSGAPDGAHSFALIAEDPDAPVGAWIHWLLWDIPVSTASLPPGFEPGSGGVSGRNDFGRRGYGGPCPPRGHGPHRYFFRLFAVDQASLGLAEGSSRRALDNALAGHVLAKAEYMGTCERKK